MPSSSTRKTANRANVAAKPTGVSFDLDAAQRKGAKKPFIFNHQNRPYTMIDVRDIDWRTTVNFSMDRPLEMIEATLSKEDFAEFMESGFPLWKMEALMEAYASHYDIGTSGEG